jgi:hypothetical protein
VIVSVELHVGVHDVGENAQEAPEGNPEHENNTDCPVPTVKVAVVVVVTEFPCKTDPEVGLVDMEKSNVGTHAPAEHTLPGAQVTGLETAICVPVTL